MYQSSRIESHQEAIGLLWDAGYVYACDCTREQVDARTKGNSTPGYDGHCRERGLERPGNAMRFKVPDTGTVVVRDLIRGDVEFPLQAIEDFVVVKSNGGPLFVLANVVDDRAMEITHVIRGEDSCRPHRRRSWCGLLWTRYLCPETADRRFRSRSTRTCRCW